jgi:hypothetical protein
MVLAYRVGMHRVYGLARIVRERRAILRVVRG